MDYTIVDCDQGSDEWFEARLGKITASRFKDVLSKGQGKTRKTYMYQLAAEIITGKMEESYSNSYMEWGTANEPAARAMYELESGIEVQQIGIVVLDDHNIAASPDGFSGKDGCIEIKCPKTTTQIDTYLSGKMPASHKAQVQGQLWVSCREWTDFVSFDPRIDGDASYFEVRVQRDNDYIRDLSNACLDFEFELKEIVKKLKG